MSEDADRVVDLIYGRWRSQILYAGAELGVFDHLARNCSKQADAVAVEIGADEKLLYRLMRALASLMDEAVREHGGVPHAFTGDGIMAVFGAPVRFLIGIHGRLRVCYFVQAALHKSPCV